MEKRKKPTLERATWPTRQAMVMHGLAMNLPWLAFVNISFAVMILLRHVLLKASDPLYPHSPQLTRIVDASMLGIIILSAALILMAWRRIAGISVVLFICSAIWSVSCFWFITQLLLPHVWPLCVILLLAGLTALYFYPEGLLAFVLPFALMQFTMTPQLTLLLISAYVLQIWIAAAQGDRQSPLLRLLDNRFTNWLGDLSYSIYLLHALVLLTGCELVHSLAPGLTAWWYAQTNPLLGVLATLLMLAVLIGLTSHRVLGPAFMRFAAKKAEEFAK